MEDWQGKEIIVNHKYYYFSYEDMNFTTGTYKVNQVRSALYSESLKGTDLDPKDTLSKDNYQQIIRLMEDRDKETVIWLDREPDHRIKPTQYNIDPILKALGAKDYG